MKYMYRENMRLPTRPCIHVHLPSNLQFQKEVLISWQKHLNREYWVGWGGGRSLAFPYSQRQEKRKESHIAVQNGILQAKASGGIIADTSFKSVYFWTCVINSKLIPNVNQNLSLTFIYDSVDFKVFQGNTGEFVTSKIKLARKKG